MTQPGPITSQTLNPGMVTNQTPVGNATNPQWVQAFVEYWSSRWANGDQTVPSGWVSALFGEPDPQDTGGVASPRTLLAFSKYAQAYRPGMDPKVDQLMPWVAPGSNDFIEDPTVTAARIAQDNWTQTHALDLATLDERSKADAVTAFNNAFQNELTKFGTQASLYNSAENVKANNYGTAANIYGTQEQAASSRYGTQANIYGTQENNRSQNLQQAGTLSGALQNTYDARTQNLLHLKSNPNDLVEAEYATRALGVPDATQQPIYKNVDSLGEVIKKLIEYQPAAAPVAPVSGPAPVAPVAAPQPVAPVAPVATPPHIVAATPVTTPAPTTYSQSANDDWAKMMAQYGAPKAAGGTPGWVSDKQVVAGDPAVPGQPNPEMIEQKMGPDGQPIMRITPIGGRMPLMRAFASGTDPNGPTFYIDSTGAPNGTIAQYPDSAYQNLPSLQYSQGNMGDAAYKTLDTGYVTGAFGTQIPGAGAMNYNRQAQIAKDPVGQAMLSSIFASRSRDLATDVAKAKARAPLGQAVSTSLVKTV